MDRILTTLASDIVQLEVLDLSLNMLDMWPSEYYEVLCSLRSKLPHISEIYLAGNPIAANWNTYAAWTINALPSLRKVDSWEIVDNNTWTNGFETLHASDIASLNPTENSDLGNFSIPSIASDDVSFAARKQNAIVYQSIMPRGSEQLPIELANLGLKKFLLDLLVVDSELDREFEFQQSSRFFLACYTVQASEQSLLYQAADQDITVKDLKNFHDKVLVYVGQAAESNVQMVLKGLAILGTVAYLQLGCWSIFTLSRAAMKYGGSVYQSTHMALEMHTIPLLKQPGENSHIFSALATFEETPEFCVALSPVVLELLNSLDHYDLDKALLIYYAGKVSNSNTEMRARMLHIFITDWIMHFCQTNRAHLDYIMDESNYFIDQEAINIDLLRLNIKILINCHHSGRAAADYVYTRQFHVDYLFRWFRSAFLRHVSGSFAPLKGALMSDLISLAAELAYSNDVIKTDLLENLHFEDLLLIIIKEESPDPLCLGKAYYALVLILKSLNLKVIDSIEQKIFEYVTQSLMDLEIMKIIDSNKFYYLKALSSKKARLKTTTWIPETSLVEISLETVYDREIQSIYSALISLIQFYLKEPGLMNHAAELNRLMIARNREAHIIDLCRIPSSEVRKLALECLSMAPIESFNEANINKFLEIHNKLGSLSSESTLSHLTLYFSIFNNILGSVSDRKLNWIAELLDYAVHDLLAVLKSKILLGSITLAEVLISTIGQMLIAAGTHSEIRPLFRTALFTDNVPEILKMEENLTLLTAGSNIERSWAGKDLLLLMDAMKNKLNTKKKVAFKVLTTIADDFGATTLTSFKEDTLTLIPTSIRDLSYREQTLWGNLDTQFKNVYLLDRDQRLTRLVEVEKFAENDQFQILLNLMGTLVSSSQYKRLGKERQQRLDPEYWASRLKGQKEDIENQLALKIKEWKILFAKYGDFSEIPKHPNEFVPPSSKPDNAELFSPEWIIYHQMQKTEVESFVSDRLWANVVLKRTPAGVIFDLADSTRGNEIRPVYIVSALFRALYNLLTIPTSDKVRTYSKKSVANNIRTLIQFVDEAGNDVLLSLKLVTIVNLSIKLQPQQPAESLDLLSPYALYVRFLQSNIDSLVTKLQKSQTSSLSDLDESLLLAILEGFRICGCQIPLIKFSEYRPIQEKSVEIAINKIFVLPIFTLMGEVLTHSFRIASGTQEGYMVAHIIDNPNRDQMLINILDTVASVTIHCSPMDPVALRLLYENCFTTKVKIRKAFSDELLKRRTWTKLRTVLADKLYKQTGIPDRVLFFTEAVMFSDHWAEVWLAVTQLNLQIMHKENLESTIAIVKHVSVSRIVRGYPMHDMASVITDQPVDTKYSFFFPHSEDVDKFIELIYAQSGPDQPLRAPVMRDYVGKVTSEFTLNDNTIQLATLVRIGETYGIGLISHTHIYVLSSNYSVWFAPIPIALKEESAWIFAGVTADEGNSDQNVRLGLTNFVDFTDADRERLKQTRTQQTADIGALDLLPDWALSSFTGSEAVQARNNFLHLLGVAMQSMTHILHKIDAEDLKNVIYDRDKCIGLSTQKHTITIEVSSDVKWQQWKRGIAKLLSVTKAAAKWKRLGAPRKGAG